MRYRRGLLALFLLLVAHRAQSATLEGYVTDPDGRPVAGARILASQESTAWDEQSGFMRTETISKQEVVSGADGGFIVERLAEGAVDLYACLDGYAMARTIGWVDSHKMPTWLALQPAIHFSGRVRDTRGKPIIGAEVKALTSNLLPQDSKTLPCSRRTSAISTRDGSFRLGPLLPGNWILETSFKSAVTSRMEGLPRSEDQSLDRIEIVLEPGAGIAGVVLDPEGKAVSGAYVIVHNELFPDKPLRTDTDKDGRYRLSRLELGKYEIKAGSISYQDVQRTLKIKAGENRADLTVGQKRREVRGRIIGPEGGLIAGAQFYGRTSSGRLCGLPGMSGEDGSFSLWVPAEVKKGMPCEIKVSDFENYFVSPSKPSFFVADELIDGIEVRLKRGPSINGRVIGLPTEELARVTVQAGFGLGGCTAPPGVGSVHTKADANGFYRLQGFNTEAPGNPGTIRVSASTESARSTEREITLEPGQEEVVLDLEFPPVYRVQGRVLDPEGLPLEGVLMELKGTDRSLGLQTQTDGSFKAEMENGTYEVTAQHEGYVLAGEQKLTVMNEPIEDFEIRMQAGSRVRGRVLGLAPWEQAGVKLQGRDELFAYVDATGSYWISDVPAGEWEVIASVESKLYGGSERIARSVVVLQPGGEAFIDLYPMADPTGARALPTLDQP